MIQSYCIVLPAALDVSYTGLSGIGGMAVGTMIMPRGPNRIDTSAIPILDHAYVALCEVPTSGYRRVLQPFPTYPALYSIKF